ncbi:zinc finger MYM-type protein 1-like [Camellia sinensis]|uniref:zinc finger MYM-type protein 1-like n=1 Tax=Camellia sinensis TaxID=4442 RepID=UPI001035723C|nr:zinc finger MYM-type protein 1-like [Camellia sinensis]
MRATVTSKDHELHSYKVEMGGSEACKREKGQGYDRASNMESEFNGLKTLILKENPCAYYVHCFAHQLQLALVAVSKNHNQIALLFTLVSNVVNVVGASLTDVLEMISEDGSNSEQRAEANVLLDSIQSFEFVFNLHLMKTILAITSELLQALQRKDQDIVNAMNLVQISKVQLQKMREMELMVFNDQLDTYIIDMLSSSEFSILNEIADLAKKMVETRSDKIYPLVYLLLTLALVLPVATTTVERVFSAMNIVKNRLWNRMGDEWMNDSLVV